MAMHPTWAHQRRSGRTATSLTKELSCTKRTMYVPDRSHSASVCADVYIPQTRFDTPKFREYHRRMQIFVLLFIEGGSYIDEDDERWELVTLFEKRKHATKKDKYTYHFVGYTSLYRFLHWPDKIRLRLSSVLSCLSLHTYQLILVSSDNSSFSHLFKAWATDVRALPAFSLSALTQYIRSHILHTRLHVHSSTIRNCRADHRRSQ